MLVRTEETNMMYIAVSADITEATLPDWVVPFCKPESEQPTYLWASRFLFSIYIVLIC